MQSGVLLTLLIIILVSGCVSDNTPTTCADDTTLCPDGTPVERVPPECDFKPCPACSEGDTINGTCEDGTEYLKLVCDRNGEWHEVMYFRDPCGEILK